MERGPGDREDRTKGRPGRPSKDGAQASGPRPGHDLTKALKGARSALWKNPENLTETQQAKLDWIATTDPRLHRGYLLKEGLRTVFVLGHNDGPEAGIEALNTWLGWAARCRIPTFVELGRKIRKHRTEIEAAIREDLSNALVESTNTKIRVLTRVAFGFHTRSTHRPRHAQPRRPPPRPPRPHLTSHGYVRRVEKSMNDEIPTEIATAKQRDWAYGWPTSMPRFPPSPAAPAMSLS